MLIIMDKSTHEEPLAQPLQTNNKKVKIAITLLTGYNGIFNVTNTKNKVYFKNQLLRKLVLYYATRCLRSRKFEQ